MVVTDCQNFSKQKYIPFHAYSIRYVCFLFSVNKEAEDHFSVQMAQGMFYESKQDGRSGEAPG